MVNLIRQPSRFMSYAKVASGLLSSLCFLAAAAALSAQPATAPNASAAAFERCRAIKDPTARLDCYERATSSTPESTEPSTQRAAPAVGSGSNSPGVATTAGKWRLVRTPNPEGGKEVVSIMQTADTAKSDVDLAGLMLSCGEHDVKAIIILITPLPPRAHPKVTVQVGGAREEFTGAVVPPGAEVVLPQEASVLVSGPWTTAAELSVRIDDQAEQIKGVIPLTGLGQALPTLLANCRSP